MSDTPKSEILNRYSDWKSQLGNIEQQYMTLNQLDNRDRDMNRRVKHTIRLQDKQIHVVRDNLKEVRDKLELAKRRVEIGENEFSMRSFHMFFLQSLLVFILLSMLVALLVKNGNVDTQTAMVLEGAVAFSMTGIVLYNLYINRYRNPTKYDEINWSGPVISTK